MSFSRRRVGLACTFCRHRKRRCDAKKPSCTNCKDSEAECRYDEMPVQRLETAISGLEIITKLEEIESLLQTQAQSMAALSAEVRSHTMRVETTVHSPISHHSLANGRLGTPTSPANLSNRMDVTPTNWFYDKTSAFQDNGANLPPLTIPVKHNTSSNYLLCLPEMKSLIGEYPKNLFFLLESRNPLPPELSLTSWNMPHLPGNIDKEITDYLVLLFFSEVHSCHPILDQEAFNSIYTQFLERGIDNSIESALCLVVFALGATVNASRDFSTIPGMDYMQCALPTMISSSNWAFEWHIFLPQTLVLASIYFSYITRPLQSWRLVSFASTMLQLKISRLKYQQDSDPSRESFLRLFWSCFLIESDRLAELELPQSGLQQLIDETRLPSCSNLNNSESTCYLAEISIRRLLNRIHNTLYPHKTGNLSSTSLATSGDVPVREISSTRAICDELHRQLDIWYYSIPEPYRPALGVETTPNDRDRVLRIRYYATKHIIYRPFVLYVIARVGEPIADLILEKCSICIESCRLYIYNTGHILKRASQYTWTFSLSSLGAVVVLTLASICPGLKHLVPDIDELQGLVIDNLTPWVTPSSSLEAVTSIVRDIQKKQRMLACI